MYTAAVLTSISAQLLRWIAKNTFDLQDFVFETIQGLALPHHMTICLGPIEKSSLHDRSIIGCEVILKIDSLVHNKNLGVCAAPVCNSVILWTTGNSKHKDVLKSTNVIPHITTCILPSSKPFFSNQMLEKPNSDNVVEKLDQGYSLMAIITELD